MWLCEQIRQGLTTDARSWLKELHPGCRMNGGFAALVEEEQRLHLIQCSESLGAIQHQLERCLCSSTPTSTRDIDRAFSLLAALQRLYLGEASAAFTDPQYWEQLSAGLSVTNDLSEPLAERRRSQLNPRRWSRDAADQQLRRQGFTVLPAPPAAQEGYAALHNTVLRLREAGWPPAFLLVYDEVWTHLVDPWFDAYELLLGEGCTMAADLNVWALMRRATGSAYAGQNFGMPHRDMSFAKCHGPSSHVCLNAWVPINPSGATARNGAMRLVARQHDAAFEGMSGQHDAGSTAALSAWLQSPLVHVEEAPAGSLVTWVPCLVHWGGSCEDEADAEPRVSVAATFCESGVAVYGADGRAAAAPPPVRRGDLASLSLSQRLSYAANALLSFAHWHEGFPTWISLGDALHEQGALDRALASYDNAIVLMPRDVEARTSRGHVLLDLGRAEEAAAAFGAALELSEGGEDEDIEAFREEALRSAAAGEGLCSAQAEPGERPEISTGAEAEAASATVTPEAPAAGGGQASKEAPLER